jgi:ATP-dependent helicase/DNAse subunit B
MSYRPEYNGLQLINREVIISYLIRLLEIDKLLTPFSIVGLECKVGSEVAFETSSGERKINVGGTIDRMDIIHKDGNDYIRVVDYKTGRAPSMLTYNMDEVFSGVDLAKKHSNYHLQAMLYSLIVSKDKQLNQAHLPVSPALLYIQRTQGDDYDPTLSLGKDKITDVATYRDDFMQHLQQTLADIMDTTKDFSPTDDRQRCATCPYIQLCHFQNSKK